MKTIAEFHYFRFLSVKLIINTHTYIVAESQLLDIYKHPHCFVCPPLECKFLEGKNFL